jgi:DNA-binding XRE family transcriptional regulator
MTDNAQKKLGERLKAARTRSGLKQEVAAEKLSLSRTTLIAIEKGERYRAGHRRDSTFSRDAKDPRGVEE